jgi:hypothetical protein
VCEREGEESKASSSLGTLSGKPKPACGGLMKERLACPIADVWGFKMKHALAILYASRAECGTIPTYPSTDPVG